MKSFIFRHLEPLSILKKIAKLCGTVVFAAFAFLIYCFYVPHGSEIALQLITQFSPYEIEFREANGSFATQLAFEDLKVNGPRVSLTAAHVELSWDWLDFINTQTITHVLARDAHITVASATTPQSKPLLTSTENIEAALGEVKTEIHKVNLPIKVSHLILENSTVVWGNENHQITTLALHGADTQSDYLFQEIHYQGSAGTLDATIADTVNLHWDLQFNDHPLLAKYASGKLTTKGHILFLKNQLESNATKLNIALQATKIHAGPYPLENVSLHFSGTLAAHQAIIASNIDGYPVKGTIYGKLEHKKWSAKLSDLTVSHEKWQQMGTTNALLTVDWRNKQILTNLDALLWDKYPLSVALKTQKAKPYAISGTIQSQIKEIKTLAPLIPDLKAWRAKCNINLALSGTLSNPAVIGDVLFKEVKLRYFVWGSKATISELRAQLLPGSHIKIHGEGIWGSGPFTLKGDGHFKKGAPEFTLNLIGNNLLLSDTPEYYILANPDLTLTIKDNEPLLTGTILIPEAEIQSLKNPDMVTTSGDVVIVSAQKPQAKPLNERSFATALTTQIEIILGKKITYKNRDFTTHATGRLAIRQLPGQMPNAKGQIDLVNGKYKAYGKTFDIDHGQIVFSGGPINDPLLDIRAQRKIEPTSTLVSAKSNQAIIAGIKFSGNLKAPKLQFYSVPALPDADIISYLIIGRPQSQVSEAQAELLLQAVSELVSVMGNQRHDVQLDLAEKLKLDQFGFSKKANALKVPGHNPLEDTVFVLGKQLSDRLYLHYSLGVVDSANNFGLRYMLGKNVMVEASTGTEGSSADVLLSFEGH